VKSSRAGARKTTHPQARRCPTAEWAHRDTGTSEGGRSPRTPASSTLRFGGDVCLPSGVERLLLDVVADGFVPYCCGPRAAPRALVASYLWEDHVDLLTIRRLDRIITARIPAPAQDRFDVFAPEAVVWAYEGPPQPALRALLNLPPPTTPSPPSWPAEISGRTKKHPVTGVNVLVRAEPWCPVSG
jgi:hypothetical protein